MLKQHLPSMAKRGGNVPYTYGFTNRLFDISRFPGRIIVNAEGGTHMEKYIPYEKLSEKEKRKLDSAKRGTWGGINPVTRKPSNSKA